MGAAYYKLGQFPQAIDAFKQAVRLQPNNAEAHNNLGNAYYKAARYAEAVEAYKAAIAIKHDYAEAHFSLGVAYLTQGNRSAAKAEYDILKNLNPQLANQLDALINQKRR